MSESPWSVHGGPGGFTLTGTLAGYTPLVLPVLCSVMQINTNSEQGSEALTLWPCATDQDSMDSLQWSLTISTHGKRCSYTLRDNNIII